MHVEAGVLVRQAAERFGDRTALTWSGGSQTFRELNEAANRVGSAMLDLGVRRGDRVGVLAYNTPEVVQTWFGFEKHNLVRVVLHSHFDMTAHVWSLNNVEASALVFDTRFADHVAAAREELKTVEHFVAVGPNPPEWATAYDELVSGGDGAEPLLDVDENAPCFLQLTSGTTGHPKAWVKTYRSWQAVINHNLHHLDTFGSDVPPVGSDDVNVHFHPLQWATGFQTLYPYVVRGARTVLVDDENFDPAALIDVLVAEGATGTFVPGPLLTPILDALEDRGGVDHRLRRMVVFFGSRQMLERTTRLLGPIWAHGFGSTEQGAVTTRLLPSDVEDNPERLDSVGLPGSPFLEVAIFDEDGARLGAGEVGEIVVRSAMSIGEYWGLEDQTAEAFFPGDWFRPYDVGYLDEDGFLFYADRASDRITSADGIVYPHLVEAAIAHHRAVATCGVVGVGEEGRQEIVAAVQLKNGVSATPELREEILDEVSRQLLPHERPVRVEFLEELPTVLGGAKVQRGALREQLSA